MYKIILEAQVIRTVIIPHKEPALLIYKKVQKVNFKHRDFIFFDTYSTEIKWCI